MEHQYRPLRYLCFLQNAVQLDTIRAGILKMCLHSLPSQNEKITRVFWGERIHSHSELVWIKGIVFPALAAVNNGCRSLRRLFTAFV